MVAGDARAQLSVVAYAPPRVAACESAEVSVAATLPGTVSPRIGLPSFAPFTLLRTSATSRTGIDAAGRAFTFIEGRYVLTTDRVGTFTIPPFEVRAAGVVARSRPVTITVTAARGAVPNVVTRARIDTTLDVNFRAMVAPETVYVGQQATYEVAVFLGERVRDRLRRNPTFFPPEMQSVLAYDLPTRQGDPPRRRVGSRCFDALVYQRAVFPLMPGRIVIPPAQLSYALSLGGGSIFGREESRDARTDSVALVAVEPPSDGRPADFSGAVGAFAVRSRVDTTGARVGDPLRFTVRVEGTGNLKLLPRPAVAAAWADLVAGDERVEVDSTAPVVRGAKEFDWVLTPRVAGELDVPPVRYSYFDPDARRYATAAAPPLRLRVEPGSLAAGDETPEAEEPPLPRRVHRGPVRRPLHRNLAFWALVALAPLPALGRRASERRRRAAAAAPAAARARVAVAKASDVRALRRAFIDAVADRVALPAETFTRTGALARALRRAGAARETARDAETLLRTLDAAAFGGAGAPEVDRASAQQLLDRIAREALPRAELTVRAMRALTLVAAATLCAGGVAWAARGPGEADFRRGVVEWDAGRFGAAQVAFTRAGNAAPRAPDAWANLGAAAWRTRDTAVAVASWQRALRLEPGADDVRARLDELATAGLRSPGFVPPVATETVALLAALCWCLGWLAAAFSPSRRVPTGMAVGLLTTAALLALVALDVESRARGRDVAVVARTQPLGDAATAAAEQGATVHQGDVVRVVAREGGWARVRADVAREGWLREATLIPVSGEPMPVRQGPPGAR